MLLVCALISDEILHEFQLQKIFTIEFNSQEMLDQYY